MKILESWGTPIIGALIFVTVLRMYFFSFYVVQSENMNNTLQKKDIVLIQKSGKIRPNNIVLTQINKREVLSRCVATPGDTLILRKGIVFLNGKKFEYTKHPKTNIRETYILKTNRFVQNLLVDKNIHFNKKLSYLGVYQINTDKNRLNNLMKVPVWKSVKKEILAFGLYDDRMHNFVNRFYWNPDNTGKIIIPQKGMKIELNPYNYELYKTVIKNETGILPTRIHSKIYIAGKLVKTYTFKNNYYFVINDNRSTKNDSRYFGFIGEKEIVGKLVLRLK